MHLAWLQREIGTDMTCYEVTFILPVDNPVNNVRLRRVEKKLFFEVPINHPNAHNMGLAELIAGAQLSELLDLSPGPNTEKRHLEQSTAVGEILQPKGKKG